MQVTIQTKITDENAIAGLEKMCREIAHLRCLLLRDLLAGENTNTLKKQYISEYGLTARQFNSLSSEVRGLIKSAKELRKLQIHETKKRIQSQQKSLQKLARKLKDLAKSGKTAVEKLCRKGNLLHYIHQKKRKLDISKHRLKRRQDTPISICLGTKKLFLAQYHLEENGYNDHAEWLQAWRSKRSNRIFYIGSKDEKFGNQNCQLIPAGEGQGRLQVRVLPRLQQQLGQYLEVPLEFSYGEDLIQHALAKPQAINYRFVRKDKGWYLFLTTKRPVVKKTTQRSLGAIGVDVNKAHLAFSETDRFGNLIKFGKVPILVQDRSSHQVSAAFGEAIRQIVMLAKQQQKPIVIEKLDFAHKKTQFALFGKNYRRMLSYFAYAKFHSMIHAKAYREGVEVIEVNPAFSSVIGNYKFSHMYGVSIHIAAALVLARRGLWLRESLPTRTALCLAVHRHWHVWKQWRMLVSAVSNREHRVGLDPRLMPSRNHPDSRVLCLTHLSSYS